MYFAVTATCSVYACKHMLSIASGVYVIDKFILYKLTIVN